MVKHGKTSDQASGTARDSVDVLIVGGGLAGFSMAASLCQLPLSIAVIEATEQPLNQSPSFDDRALALSYGSLKILNTLGVLSADSRQFEQTLIKTIHVSDRGHAGFLRMNSDEVNVDCLGAVIPARDLGAALFEFLQSSTDHLAKIEHYLPAMVESIVQQKNAADVQVVNMQSQQRSTLSAKIVILADGGRSPLHQQLGISKQTNDYQQVGILANLRAATPHRNIAYERFTQYGPIALLPLRERDYKLVWTVAPEQQQDVLAFNDTEFLQQIQREFGDRAGQFLRVGERVSYPMSETKAAQMVAGRVVLVGNAAHALHPIAGQGFNLGLRDVACLAELIANACVAEQDIGSIHVATQYAKQRETDIARTALFTDSLVRLFSNDHLPLAALRNLGLLAIDRVPALKHEVMYKMMGLSGKQSRLLQGMPLIANGVKS